MKAKGEECDKNMRFDAMFNLVIDRAHGQIAFEIFERLFDLGKPSGNFQFTPFKSHPPARGTHFDFDRKERSEVNKERLSVKLRL